MADKLGLFPEATAQKIIRFVQNAQPQVHKAGERLPLLTVDSGLWVRIEDSAETDSIVYHAWSEVRRTIEGWEDVNAPEQRTGTTTVWPAIAPDLSQVPNDTYCFILLDVLRDETGADVVVGTILTSAGSIPSPQYPDQYFGGGVNNRGVFKFITAHPPLTGNP